MRAWRPRHPACMWPTTLPGAEPYRAPLASVISASSSSRSKNLPSSTTPVIESVFRISVSGLARKQANYLVAAPERLSSEARGRLESSDTQLYLSAASGWEMAIKQKLGRLELGGPAELVIPELMLRSEVTPLPITHQHGLRAGALPSHHRDPFDRMLISQAQLEGLPIMTADAAFSAYAVERIAC